MLVSASTTRFELTMGATLQNIDEAEVRLCRFLNEARAPVDLFAIRILLREALLNAVIHGSDEHPERQVGLTCTLGEDELRLIVADTGPGFPWESVSFETDMVSDGGRGLPIMKIYSSDLSFNEAGNQVTLVRKYEPATATVIEGEDR